MSSADLAATLVAELQHQGVRDAVLCPGSRSAPLAYAFHRAARSGTLQLHVRIDERSAGFLALGLAAATRRPVPVVCTSGTAAANLHPAVLEAAHRGVPLLALTADRPSELIGTGANQTTDQSGLFGRAVRWQVTVDSRQPAVAPATARAVGWATGALSDDPGPVHVNISLGEPLVTRNATVRPPSGPTLPSRPFDERTDGPPHVARSLIVAGDGTARVADDVRHLVRITGWPVIAEPSAGLNDLALPHGILLLNDAEWLGAHRPERIVAVGSSTLHRATQRLLADVDVETVVVADGPRWSDAARHARHVVAAGWLRRAVRGVDPSWGRTWREASAAVARTVDSVASAWPGGFAVARTVMASLPPGAVAQLGSSNPVRDVDLAAVPRPDVEVVANRGLAGIDGTLSSAVGLALAHRGAPAYALIGDLTFLHDLNGLVIGPGERRPDLTVVVVNDDGGGIFHTLEQGAEPDRDEFERLFGTPTGADLAGLCRGVGVPHVRVDTSTELAEAVAQRPDGLRVVEVRMDRAGLIDRHAELHAAARRALH